MYLRLLKVIVFLSHDNNCYHERKMTMTLYELLNRYTIEELWYILQYRHDLSRKPIKAERIFNSYKSAYEELIALHVENNPSDSVLVCDFTIENDSGGAPDTWIHCNMLSPNEDNNGEMQRFAMDFIPWNQLIDCIVSNDSLKRLGALVCAAELLWEITFYGYSKNTVDNESEALQKITADIDSGKAETYTMSSDDWKSNEDEIASNEKAAIEWLLNAPDKVKNIVFGFYAAEVCSRNEDVDDITVDEILKRLKLIIDESSVDGAGEANYIGLLKSMVYELDMDNKYLLLSKMFV